MCVENWCLEKNWPSMASGHYTQKNNDDDDLTTTINFKNQKCSHFQNYILFYLFHIDSDPNIDERDDAYGELY